MAALKKGDYSVDAVVSFFSIIHVDRRLRRGLIRAVRSFLPRGGLIPATMGNSDWEGEEEFLGVQMACSHFDRSTNRKLMAESGFSVVCEDLHPGNAPGGDDWHPIFLARALWRGVGTGRPAGARRGAHRPREPSIRTKKTPG